MSQLGGNAGLHRPVRPASPADHHFGYVRSFSGRSCRIAVFSGSISSPQLLDCTPDRVDPGPPSRRGVSSPRRHQGRPVPGCPTELTGSSPAELMDSCSTELKGSCSAELVDPCSAKPMGFCSAELMGYCSLEPAMHFCLPEGVQDTSPTCSPKGVPDASPSRSPVGVPDASAFCCLVLCLPLVSMLLYVSWIIVTLFSPAPS